MPRFLTTKSSSGSGSGGGGLWADGLRWLFTYALLWLVLGAGSGWVFGIPCVLLATAAALWLQLRPWRVHLRHVPGFLLFFVRSILAGALDVALCAWKKSCPVQPGWATLELHHEDPRTRLLLSAAINLFPGTLSAHLDGTQMRVHVLNGRLEWRATVRQLKERLARLIVAEPLS